MTGNGEPTVRVADRYRLERRIGRGGAGAVWRAHDENLDRKVAVKQITIASEAEARSRGRALREARAAARLHVPNVVQVYDVIEEAGSVYLIMELVEAPNLSTLVRRKGALAPRDAAALGLQMLDALEAAHRAGIVHRDVKPSNVLLHQGTARLTDFGIARLSDDQTLTATGVVMGTPAYIAPEHAQGADVGPAIDLYGLGATLYYLVEGQAPFSAQGSLSTVMAVINSPPRPLTQAGPLTDLLSALLAKDPEARPAPDEIRRQLREVAGHTAARTGIMNAPWVGTATDDDIPAASGGPAATGDASAATRDAEGVDPAAATPEAAPAADSTTGAGDDTGAGDAAGADVHHAGAPADRPRTDLAGPGDDGPAVHAADPARRRVGALAGVLGLAVVAALGLNAAFGGGGQDASDGASQPAVAPPPAEEQSTGNGRAGAGVVPSPDPSTPPPSEASQGDDGVLPATDAEVPGNWVEYAPDDAPYRLWHPPDWEVERVNATLTDIRDPETGTYLRLDWVDERRDPVRAWEELEPSFAGSHRGYERIGITPTTFKGDRAALWEYRYREGGAQLHAYNLGVNQDGYGFALNMQARQAEWEQAQDVWARLLSGYEFTGP